MTKPICKITLICFPGLDQTMSLFPQNNAKNTIIIYTFDGGKVIEIFKPENETGKNKIPSQILKIPDAHSSKFCSNRIDYVLRYVKLKTIRTSYMHICKLVLSQ